MGTFSEVGEWLVPTESGIINSGKCESAIEELLKTRFPCKITDRRNRRRERTGEKYSLCQDRRSDSRTPGATFPPDEQCKSEKRGRSSRLSEERRQATQRTGCSNPRQGSGFQQQNQSYQDGQRAEPVVVGVRRRCTHPAEEKRAGKIDRGSAQQAFAEDHSH